MAGDFSIPVVWPGQRITVPEDMRISPQSPDSVSGVGHAGVIIVDGSTGFTKYYEYGRYGSADGVIRSRSVANVEVVDGKITKSSLEQLMKSLPSENGSVSAGRT